MLSADFSDIMMIVIFITFNCTNYSENIETCFSPRLSSVTGLVCVAETKTKRLLDAMVVLAGDLDGK